ncbi:MAG: cytochrome c oxidase subunit 3 [Parasphingorhabdus sp.]|uniref:cytochrome c oxidase subunit 3 n=1 Tax=Parasphingorhabdus sp. TaxID=2709688 RepID=UPI0030017B2A
MTSLKEALSAGPDKEANHAALPGIAVFAFVDIASFMVFFIIFMVERLKAEALFASSASMLNLSLGLVNTLILVTSGFCVAMAEAKVVEAGGGPDKASKRWLLGGIAVGAFFFFTKLYEYNAKISVGINPTTDIFFTYYFVLTGIHFIHYLAGIVLLSLLASGRWRAKSNYAIWMRSGALYWHMVDIIWLVMFPILYLQTGAGS